MAAPSRPASSDARAVADAVLAVPTVDGFDSGRHGEVALLYPGLRVPGLRWAGGRLELHLRALFDPEDPVPLALTSEVARAAANDALGGRFPIDVIVADVARAAQTTQTTQTTQTKQTEQTEQTTGESKRTGESWKT